MATSLILANDAGAPVGSLEAIPLDDAFLIRTDQVDMADRLRPIDMVWADALGGIMKREGQRTPIEVCRLPGRERWTLAGGGGHRLTGALIHEIEYLKATVVSSNAAERRMAEVSENLWRRELDPIDRAACLAELVLLHKQKSGIDPAADGRVASANARWQKAVSDEADDTKVTMTLVYGWTDAIAEQIGVSASLIKRDLTLYRRLSPSLISQLRDARHPIAKNASQLRALAKLPADEQAQVVDRLLLRSNSKDFVVQKVGDALTAMRGGNQAPDPEAKRMSAFLGAFERMGVAEKRGALAMLAPLLPAGQKLVGENHPSAQVVAELAGFLDQTIPLLRQIYDDPRTLADTDLRTRCDKAADDLQLSRMSLGSSRQVLS